MGREGSLPEVAATVQEPNRLLELGNGPVDDGIGHYLADRSGRTGAGGTPISPSHRASCSEDAA